jgi:hypothetical protein
MPFTARFDVTTLCLPEKLPGTSINNREVCIQLCYHQELLWNMRIAKDMVIKKPKP